MSIETVRLSQQAKDQLIKLKRRTGVQNWNVLCRWAFCVSLAEPTPVQEKVLIGEGAVEMSWKTFGGKHQEIYLALLKQRCLQEGIPVTDRDLSIQFRQHLHRGVSYLAASDNIGNISDLLELAGQSS
ncbi:DNA sulfur modification protein DndE [Desulfolutivibrio sp.]|uniref:DNA sulfur modification protein DndE n=1 Tax=Desulfolutivibrio sp. TaxID=2773296 RepID=UPI002F963698